MTRIHPFNYHLKQMARNGANPLFIGVSRCLTGV
uniref:Uncharacterized protein n=1 Tax=Myoviridae sp. ctFYw8 TaxID=2825069 RepID=A0A8S5PDX5_9CAUD|nr:MAG TPA: hypothetical protein [Myoviridae sp. ctFYw8]